MKSSAWLILCALWAAGPPTPALAQSEDEDAAALERALEDARGRLEEAAREVAELSGRLVGDVAVQTLRDLPGLRRRATLGLEVGPTEGGGVTVRRVVPEGPADRAGLAAGDVLLELDGKPLEGSGRGAVEKLVQGLAEREPGSEVRLRYRRDGEEREVVIETGSGPPHGLAWLGHSMDEPLRFGLPWPPFLNRWGDLELASISPTLGRYFGTDEGLLVVHAPRDAALGLQDGDVILSIGGRRPENPSHAMRILHSYAPGERLELEILRQRERRILEVELPERVGAPEPAQWPDVAETA